jgi:tRNA A-37 threonylcarbamoyl transferase component Bud32
LFLNTEDREWLKQIGVSSPDALRTFRQGKVAAMSDSSETIEVDLEDFAALGAPPRIFVKRYRYRSIKALIGGCFRGTLFGRSRARREFEALIEMRKRGVDAVRPIAYAENRRRGTLRDCTLVTEGEFDVHGLASYYVSNRPKWDHATRRRFIQHVADSIRGMHETGVTHGGLFWRNIMVKETAGNEWAIIFLDPEHRIRDNSTSAPLHKRRCDLSDFVASALAIQAGRDVARFLRSYEGRRGSVENRKTEVRAILTDAHQKKERERHRIAVAELISLMRKRTEQRDSPYFDSIESLLTALESADRYDQDTPVNGVIRFEIDESPRSDKALSWNVVFEGRNLRVTRDSTSNVDLLIRGDLAALLEIVNGHADGFKAVRKGRVQLKGNERTPDLLTAMFAILSNDRVESDLASNMGDVNAKPK